MLRSSLLLLPLLGCGLASVAQAQTRLVLPALFEDVYGRGSSAALGGSSTRTQMVFASPFAANTMVLGFGLRATGSTADRAAFTADLEVRASSTANAPGALSATFSANVGSDEVVVLPRQMVNVAAMPANRSAGTFAQLPFGTPFTFGTNGNTNINIELLVYGRSTGASWSTDRCFASANGMATTMGRGCGSGTINSTSTNGSYVANSTINVTIGSATPGGVAWLLPSVDMAELAPGVPLPLSLSLFGGAACDVLVNPLLMVAVPLDGAGAASVSIPLGPVNQLNTAWQWLYSVPPSGTNPIGIETTAARRILIGPEVCVPIGQYVWDLSNVNSLTGNNTTDSVPIVQFILP
jgi:hypothetical protein